YGFACGGLLRRALARSLAPPEGYAAGPDLHNEAAAGPARFFHYRHIIRRFMPARLDKMLKTRLRVDWCAFARELLELGLQRAKDECLGGAEPVSAEDGADHGFEEASEVAVAGTPTGSLFAAAKDEVRAEVEPFGNAGEGAALHHLGAHASEFAFA